MPRRSRGLIVFKNRRDRLDVALLQRVGDLHGVVCVSLVGQHVDARVGRKYVVLRHVDRRRVVAEMLDHELDEITELATFDLVALHRAETFDDFERVAIAGGRHVAVAVQGARCPDDPAKALLLRVRRDALPGQPEL